MALEGLIHAGKSTISSSLCGYVKDVSCVPEYIEFTKTFPNFPKDYDDVLKAWDFFINLEKKRKNTADWRAPIVVLDRSILSILAYNYAISRFTDGKIHYLDVDLKCLNNQGWMIPDVCIYLEISDSEISRRHQKETGRYDKILLNSKFNASLREFYIDKISGIFPSMEFRKINANEPIEKVFSEVQEVIFTSLNPRITMKG